MISANTASLSRVALLFVVSVNERQTAVTLITTNTEEWVCETMSMGAYDNDEHERRERMSSEVDTSFDDERNEYRGSVEYESGESAEQLLDQFKQMQSE